MVDRAEKVAAGKRPLKKDRFVRIDAAGKGVDWDLVERARQLAGLKGYVTNLPTSTMDGAAVVAAYHDLWQVEKSFRMAKSDLRARPIFHRERDADRSPPDRRVRRARGQPPSAGHHRGLDQASSCAPCGRSARQPSVSAAQEITLDPDIPAAAQDILRSATGQTGH